MAFVLANRVKETTTTAGTGTVTLLGASTGFQSFAIIGNTNTTYYTIASQSGSEWEVGIGTYSTTGPTLTRTTVLASSTGGAAINFSAGTKDVFVTYPAGKSVDQNGTVLYTYASYTANATVTVKAGTASIAALAISNLSVYPNPVKEFLTVKFDSKSIATVELVNVAGQVIDSKVSSDVTFNTSSLVAGVYFVNIKVAEGVFTQKVIKE